MWFDREALKPRGISLLAGYLDKSLFLVVFLLGAAYIGGAKWLGLNQLWVTLGPVLLMSSYAAAITLFRRFRVDASQAGDSLYYLGFLFTLCSLAVALYLSGASSNREYIIQNFGVALFTTILGLMLRVLFGQMQHDPVETEREVRLQLVEMSSQLRNDIIQIRGSMDVALIAVQQQSTEAVSRYVDQLNDIVGNLASKTTEHFKSFSEEAGNFNDTTSKLVGAVEALVERVNQVNAPTDLLASKLAPSVEAIAEAADEVRKRAKADKGLVDKMVLAVQALTTAAEQAESKIQSATEESGRAEQIFGRLADITEKFDQAATGAKANLEFINTMARSHEALGTQFQQHLDTAGSLLVEEARSVGSRQAEVLQQMEQAFLETLQRIRIHNDSLASELERSKQYTTKVHTALVSMTQALTKEVTS
jgi:hypothetical protein